MPENWNAEYLKYRDLFQGYRFPLAFVDLDAFDINIWTVASTQRQTGKTIRVATKSIRSIDLIRRVFKTGGPIFQGLLAFTMEEAAFLAENGFDDIIVAYPSVQPTDLELLIECTRRGSRMRMTADSLPHLQALSRAASNAGVIVDVCLDADMSYRPLGSLHLGVRRSPLHTPADVMKLVKAARSLPGIRITDLMAYEAQIASTSDAAPGRPLKNRLIRWMKNRSVRELSSRRTAIAATLRTAGFPIRTVNGGGSGSLVSTGKDATVTEVTAGSAFFAPGLFRHFCEVKFRPAAFFGLQVARIPARNLVTCQGGGYVGSGQMNPDRLPWPVMPEGLRYLSREGAGEVQTPLSLPHGCPALCPGDPVFFQHAKAGELCERFNRLLLVKDGRVVGDVPTYRGQGKAFL